MTEYVITTISELLAAFASATEGDKITVEAGTYKPASQLVLNGSNVLLEGTGNVIIDGSLVSLEALGSYFEPLIRINGNQNTIRNVRITKSVGAGICAFGSDCFFDHVEADHNGGAGLNTHGDRTRFHYCIGHDNSDPQTLGEHADGMGASSPATGCYFLGCVAYGNSDDGIDVYGSTGNTIEKCVAFGNGLLGQGNGSGFKMGDVGGNNIITKCIAYNNRQIGFNLGGGSTNVCDHCTAFGNGGGVADPINMVGWDFVWQNIHSTRNSIGKIGTIWYNEDIIPAQNNSWDYGITDFGFQSTDPSSPDFLSLKSDSACRNKAVDGSDLGALQYGEKISDLIMPPTPPPQMGFLALHAFIDSQEVIAAYEIPTGGLMPVETILGSTPDTVTLVPASYTVNVSYLEETKSKPFTVLPAQTVTVNVQFAAAPPIVFTCSICGATFNTQADLNDHMLIAHPVTPPAQKTYAARVPMMPLLALQLFKKARNKIIRKDIHEKLHPLV